MKKTWDALVMLELTGGKDLIMPGEDAKIKLTIRKPMVCPPPKKKI